MGTCDCPIETVQLDRDLPESAPDVIYAARLFGTEVVRLTLQQGEWESTPFQIPELGEGRTIERLYASEDGYLALGLCCEPAVGRTLLVDVTGAPGPLLDGMPTGFFSNHVAVFTGSALQLIDKQGVEVESWPARVTGTVSPSSGRAIIVNYAGSFDVYSVEDPVSGRVLATIDAGTGPLFVLPIGEDETWLAHGGSMSSVIFKVSFGHVQAVRLPSEVAWMTVDRSGRFLLVVLADGTIAWLDPVDGDGGIIPLSGFDMADW